MKRKIISLNQHQEGNSIICLATRVVAWVSLAVLLQGCQAPYQVSPNFEPALIEQVAVVVGSESNSMGSRDGEQVRLIEDIFIEGLIERAYGVVSRSDIRPVVEEGDFQRTSGLTTDDAARVGKMLNATAVLIVTYRVSEAVGVRKYEVSDNRGRTRIEEREHYDVTAVLGARMIDVETGEVLWASRDSTTWLERRNSGDFHGPITELAWRVVRVVPDRFSN